MVVIPLKMISGARTTISSYLFIRLKPALENVGVKTQGWGNPNVWNHE